MTQNQTTDKSKISSTKQFPCENCITFAICNAIVVGSVSEMPIISISIIFKLYDRCSLIRDYIIDPLSTYFHNSEELFINRNRLEITRSYFNEFKRRDRCSKD